jgi:hypothetical protein
MAAIEKCQPMFDTFATAYKVHCEEVLNHFGAGQFGDVSALFEFVLIRFFQPEERS